MNPEQLLKDLLASQDLLPEQEAELERHKDEVTKLLREKFGDTPVIKYAGSKAKGTMNREGYDLDIVCYFPSNDTRSLKEIRQEVSDHLSSRYLMEDKASAERITNLKNAAAPQSYHIDVVPGRFIEGSKDVFLHVAYGEKERMQTNLKTHIDYIANSGCVDVIRLAKLWNSRNNLTVKTFVLEIFVVKALSGSRNKANLRVAFTEALEAFRDQFGTIQLEDPANSNNIVSKLISPSHRVMVVNAATDALEKIAASDDIAAWKAIFREGDGGGYSSPAAPSSGPSVISNPSGQWAL